jgi:hypothetical protein
MAEDTQDLFLSHSSEDKIRYIQPLTESLITKKITFWLDSLEIGWGDNVLLRINEGLRRSRYLLLCLSRSFLNRPWPEAEMASALAIQNATGQKRVLPLILNSKDSVLERYPILVSLAYREYRNSADAVAEEIAKVLHLPKEEQQQGLHVAVESVHTGKLCSIRVSPRVSVRWLAHRAQECFGISERAETGAYMPFRVKWVLVDVEAEPAWDALSRSEQRSVYAIVQNGGQPKLSRNDTDNLEDLGVRDGAVFHLYAVEDERYPTEVLRAFPRKPPREGLV